MITIAVCSVVAGCAQKRSQPAATSAKADPKQTAPVSEPTPSEEGEREKRPRFGEAAVYVDGRAVGVLRRPELPTALKARVVKLGEGYQVTRYSFAEYATSLGIDRARVKAVHFYGGSRLSVVSGDEFRRIAERLTFGFVGGDHGKPRVHWPGIPLNVNTTIDMLTGVTFYLDKEPPHLDKGELVMPDGQRVEGKVPYADQEQGNGTRIYVDGKLVGTVKRKKLTNDVLIPSKDDGPSKFSLTSYAGKLDAAAKQAKAIDFLAGDDVILHADAKKAIAFDVPRRNQGQMMVDLQVGDSTRPAKVSAVQIFVKTTPPSRSVVSLDEAAGANSGNGGGGGGGRAGGGADDDE